MSEERLRRQHRFTVTPEHLILDPRVSDRAMRLWCRLDRYAGENEVAFPSRETLAIDLDTSKSTIDRALSELCSSGWLEKERRAHGDVNLYTLIVAPAKETERIIREAREARVKASEPRREKEQQRRREQKRNAAVKGKGEQASEGGVVTSEDTLGSGGVVTHDDTGVLTHDDRGVVTHDEEKEAPLEGSIREGEADDSLRSSSDARDAVTQARATEGQTALQLVPNAATEPAPDKGAQKTRRKTRVPEDWWPDAPLRDWAAEKVREGGVAINLANSVEEFRDYHRGAGTLGLDWDAYFRTWVRRAIGYAFRDAQRGRGGRNGQGTNHQGQSPERRQESQREWVEAFG